jgi:hypothetical protein
MTLHADATSVHKGAYVQATDPALDVTLRVAAYKLWVDTSTAAPYQLKVRNAANTGWDTVGSIGAVAADYPTTLLSYSPEFYYRLNESTGNPVDASPNATPAVLNGSGMTQGVAGLLSGSTNKALQVAGAADVSIATLARLKPTVFTLVCLFKPAVTGARNPLITSNHADYWAQGRGLSLEMDGTGKLHANFSQGGVAFTHAIGVTTMQAATIYHCAVTFDGQTVNIYLNGVLEASTSFPNAISWANHIDWRIGSNQQTASGTSVYASGVIDEAALIASVLTDKQIEALAALALPYTAPDHSDIDDEYIDGFELTYVDATNVKVSRGGCFIPTSRQIKRKHAATTVSAAGLTASTFYYVYAYWSGGVLAFEVSTTAPVMYGTNAAIKSGDNSRRFIGAFLTNGSGNVFNFDGKAHGHEFELVWRELNNAAPFLILNASNPGNGSNTTQSISAVVPDIVYKKFKFLSYANVGNGDVLNVGIGSNIPASGAWYGAEFSMRVDMRNGASSATGHAQTGEIYLAARSFDYTIGYVTSGTLTLHAKGFTVRR